MDLSLIPLVKNDLDFDIVVKMHNEPTIAKYISISDTYFDYVVNAENVVYFKIQFQNQIVGGIHAEISDSTLYLSICILPQHRKSGLATFALEKLFTLVPNTVEKVQVSIDETNIASVRLFEKLGFSPSGKEEKLLDYALNLK